MASYRCQDRTTLGEFAAFGEVREEKKIRRPARKLLALSLRAAVAAPADQTQHPTRLSN